VATAHQKLAVAIVLLALFGTLWSGYFAYKGRASPQLRTTGMVMVALLAAQAVLGIVLAAQGVRPQDGLHFVWGPAAIVALPVALGLGRGRAPRIEAIIATAGWVLTLALSLRAVGSGGLS
jgi:hypothetical protein